jgi:hypothetical protein
MTQQAELFKKIDKLPPQYFGEVFDFVEYLQHKAQQNNIIIEQKEMPRGRVFGCSKGKYQITDAFFEPLEDFKDYM